LSGIGLFGPFLPQILPTLSEAVPSAPFLSAPVRF